MTWDVDAFTVELQRTTAAYDRPASEALCQDLASHLVGRKGSYPEAAAARILKLLRNKRYFDLLGRTADFLIQSGQDAPIVRLQYAQALLDQGRITAALYVLERVLPDTRRNAHENAEVVGLMGRAYKQLFVIAGKDRSPWSRRHLHRALQSYLLGYRRNPKNIWHGVNVLALLARAARADLRPPPGAPNRRTLAADIMKRLVTKRDRTEGLPVWDYASGIEASLGLDASVEGITEWLEPYVRHPAADAFELGSTLRQLVEIWQLDERSVPGSAILPLLRGALLKREGGSARVSAGEIGAAGEGAPQLENVFGADGLETVRWYRAGERRGHNVARIDSPLKGIGTGFLVRGDDLADRFKGQVLLMTNAHVVSLAQAAGALRPDRATALFFGRAGAAAPVPHSVQEVWSSPRDQLDCTLLALSPPVLLADPYPVAEKLPPKGPPSERVYVIGHPGGGELSYSLQDNELLDYNDRFMHYRAPTENGSSGSPVFNRDWELIALHHAGGSRMARLNGNGDYYQANEGICMPCIREAIREA